MEGTEWKSSSYERGGRHECGHSLPERTVVCFTLRGVFIPMTVSRRVTSDTDKNSKSKVRKPKIGRWDGGQHEHCYLPVMQVCHLRGTAAEKQLPLCFIRQHATESDERGNARFNAFFNLGTRQEVSFSHTGHLTRRPEAPISNGQEAV